MANRLYADFLMPSRLGEYESLLRSGLERGYRFVPVRDFWERRDVLLGHERVCVLQHDVDSDPRGARDFWNIERSLGLQSTYYFRLSTLDRRLVSDLAAAGVEVSYHYEELATLAKKLGLRSEDGIRRELPRMREMFISNVESLRAGSEMEIVTVAAHGDFTNRALGIPGNVVVDDSHLRERLGIIGDVWDPEVDDLVTSRHQDTLYPRFWVRGDLLNAFASEDSLVWVLFHTKHWKRRALVNLRDDAIRAYQGVSYRWRSRRNS